MIDIDSGACKLVREQSHSVNIVPVVGTGVHVDGRRRGGVHEGDSAVTLAFLSSADGGSGRARESIGVTNNDAREQHRVNGHAVECVPVDLEGQRPVRMEVR